MSKNQLIFTPDDLSSPQNLPNPSASIKSTPNSKDLLSNKSNLGSIEQSLKTNSIKSPHPSQAHNSSNKNSHGSQKSQYEWQAVYIEGKFYLSNNQTIQRYYDIQRQLMLQKIAKEKSPKTVQIPEEQKDSSPKVYDRIKTSQRVLNLQTIKFREQSQSQKQKLQDQSLLNNLDTSSQNCSRLTFQMQTPESQSIADPPIRRIDSISSISKSQKNETPIDENPCENPTNQPSNDQLNVQQKTISQKKSTIKQSSKNQSQYGYYLSTNNQKVYSKKSDHQDVQNLQSFRQQDSNQDNEENQPHQTSKIDSEDSQAHHIQKATSLKLQQKIQLPIDLNTNRLKINSPFSSISSMNNTHKQSQLPKITEEIQQHHVKQKNYRKNNFNPSNSVKSLKKSEKPSIQSQAAIEKNIALQECKKLDITQEKKLSCLSLKLAQQKLQTPSKISFKTYENIKYNKAQLQKNNSFFSNYQHTDLVDSSQKQEFSINQPQNRQKTKHFRTQQLLSKLSELSKKQKQSHQSEKKDSGFLRLRKPHFEVSKKYELPQINQKQDKKSENQVKNFSIDQKYRLVQKEEQFKIFERANNLNSHQDLSKSKIRLNGFIKNTKNGHLSALRLNQPTNSDQKVQNVDMEDERKSKSKMSRSIRSRSSFMTRNYKTSSPYQKQETEVFQPKKSENESQTNLDKAKQFKKSSSDIGKIKLKDQTHLLQNTTQNAHQNHNQIIFGEQTNSALISKPKKDTAVQANLDYDQRAQPLNPQIKSLRQNKQILLEKLQNLEKKDLENEITLIKQSIKQLQFHKLNKMAKTIDLSDHQNSTQILPSNQNSQYRLRLESIIQNFPQSIQKITKPTQIAEIKVPQEIILSNKEYKIFPTMTPEQLQQVAIKLYKLFGIDHDPNYRPPSLLTMMEKPQLSLKQRQKLLIKKFKNCVFFDLVGGQNAKLHNKTIVWNFSSEESNDQSQKNMSVKSFYIGGWSQTINTEQFLAKSNQKQKQFGKGKKNGFGLEINQKFIYQGQYLNGKKHGEGKLYLIESGYRYEGQFIENHKSGHGKEFNPFKNQIYVGQFKHDKRNGKGYLKKLLIKNKTDKTKRQPRELMFPYFFNGTFIDGNKQNGHEFFQNGDEYKGEYSNEMLDGKGVFKWLNGAQYDGEFCKNFKHGFGKWSSAPDENSGTQVFYIGEFKMNKKDGQGKYVYKNGAYYQGSFENDLKHGSGALFYEDQKKESKVLRGYWKQGNIVANEKGQIYKMKILKDEIQLQA